MKNKGKMLTCSMLSHRTLRPGRSNHPLCTKWIDPSIYKNITSFKNRILNGSSDVGQRTAWLSLACYNGSKTYTFAQTPSVTYTCPKKHGKSTISTWIHLLSPKTLRIHSIWEHKFQLWCFPLSSPCWAHCKSSLRNISIHLQLFVKACSVARSCYWYSFFKI